MTPTRLTLFIPALDCVQEEGQIRDALAGIPGLHRMQFELARHRLALEGSADALTLATRAIESTGFPSHIVHDGQTSSGERRAAWRLGVALVLALLAEALGALSPQATAWVAVSLLLAVAALALAGVQTYRKGLAALRRARFDINALMAVAVTGAVLIGEWAEAAMVMALYAVAELIEARAVDRARRSVQNLLTLAPDTALWRDAEGRWQAAPVGGLQPGAVLRIRPGERVPLDGRVLDGHSSVDEAPISGESLPVDKQAGDTVYAGTLNGNGRLDIEVTAAQQDTLLALIALEVEQAQAAKAPTQRFIDRFARHYTPAVFLLALVTSAHAAFWLGEPATAAIYRGLVMLVIACPCALVIATPVTIVSGLTAAARRGILVKGGVHLENARRLQVMALDKTGTLTTGHPTLVAVQPLPSGAENEALVMALARALTEGADHPVARAIADGLSQAWPAIDSSASPSHLATLSHVTAVPGRGVRAQWHQQPVGLGNRALAIDLGADTTAIDAAAQAHEAAGHSVSLLVAEGRVLALFAVADTLKPGSRRAVEALTRLGVMPVMLTGDSPGAADAVARAAGIGEAAGGLLPADKRQRIGELQSRYGMVGMAGDGINDAPALAQSDLSLVMGRGGTDIALQTADVVLMNDDLGRLPELVRLSQRTHRILWQNIALALGIKVLFMVLAWAGMATLWMAVFADVGASLLVVANGLRLAAPRYPTALPSGRSLHA